MPSDSGDNRRPPKSQQGNGGAAHPPPPPGQEHLPCPRCDSTNTKFCYYNNYNFSQPRHFCKSCRRYWTHGGTLRDIPVGGGSRKNAKRSRTCSSYSSAGVTSSTAGITSSSHDLFPAAPVWAGNGSGMQFGSRSFTSLLSSTQVPGFLALGGGFGHGFENVGFGVGKGVWPLTEAGFVSAHGAGGSGNGNGGIGGGVLGNTWHPESGGGGFVDVDCFSWPDLAISAHGNALK